MSVSEGQRQLTGRRKKIFQRQCIKEAREFKDAIHIKSYFLN